MSSQLRDSGIGFVGEIPWGTHFCHFYETQNDLIDILVPFFRAGLENNECCIWVVFDPLSEQQARDVLRSGVPGAERYLATGNIEIVSHSEWYLKDGIFDADRVIAGWKRKLAQALASAYAGIRVNGNETWLTEQHWATFSEYERSLDEIIAAEPIIVLCTYPLAGRSGSDVFDIAHSHQFAIARRKGEWEVVESPQIRQTKAELKKLSDHLEVHVMERTQALGAANERLRALSAKLQSAKEEEGTRIARELHDQLGSALTSLRWDLQWLEKALSGRKPAAQPGELSERLAAMMRLTDKTIDNVKSIASELRPSVLDDLGLVEAVEWQVNEFQARTGIACRFESSLESVDLSREQSTAVFRILQEALTNILRHAEATGVDITMDQRDGSFVLTIKDNGKGITQNQKSTRYSLGIWSMQERAHFAGGTTEITGAESEGTAVVVQIPLRAEPGQTRE
jgi:signal transduction histidine kinase